MHITLVQKITADDRLCRRSAQVMARLERSSLMPRIQRIVRAEEKKPQGEGWQLAARYGVAQAPFFIVEQNDETRVFTHFSDFALALGEQFVSAVEA